MKSSKKNTNLGMYEINLASLVDVALTLVIIFMVSYPFVMQSGIKISSPALGKSGADLEISNLRAEIHLREDDKIELNGKTVDSEVFSDSLRAVLEASPHKMALISADARVSHDRVVAVLDVARQNGASKLSIVRRK